MGLKTAQGSGYWDDFGKSMSGIGNYPVGIFDFLVGDLGLLSEGLFTARFARDAEYAERRPFSFVAERATKEKHSTSSKRAGQRPRERLVDYVNY